MPQIDDVNKKECRHFYAMHATCSPVTFMINVFQHGRQLHFGHKNNHPVAVDIFLLLFILFIDQIHTSRFANFNKDGDCGFIFLLYALH